MKTKELEIEEQVEKKPVPKKKFVFGSTRPPKYQTPEAMQKKIEEYFNSDACKKEIMTKEWPVMVDMPTITWLSLFLWFCDRHSFYDYEKYAKFSHTIKRARHFIEKEYEQLLRVQPTWAIFALKNFKRTDQIDIHTTDDSEKVKEEETEETLMKKLKELKTKKK